jgi:hypothetical protein
MSEADDRGVINETELEMRLEFERSIRVEDMI